ncbi:hypothetical protein ACLB2K_033484 [Fragaria x ananassa]
MIGCESDNDRVKRLNFPCSDEEPSIFSSNLVVINSTLYLIGGTGTGGVKDEHEHIAYRHLDLDLGEEGEWRPGGGNMIGYQYGEAAVGPDGYIYSVGDFEIYRFSTCGKFHEELIPPASMEHSRLLGLTRKELFIYTGNQIYCFDLKSQQWDLLDLVGNFHGDWSVGVVFFEDRYLFSFGSHNPTREEEEEADAPGI